MDVVPQLDLETISAQSQSEAAFFLINTCHCASKYLKSQCIYADVAHL